MTHSARRCALALARIAIAFLPSIGLAQSAPPSNCPCTLFGDQPGGGPANDTGAVELGLKFQSDRAAAVSGVRFYKHAANTGTHVGRLWSGAGTLLANVTFSDESASGWQQAAFAAPVPISASTTYVISVHMPNGNYAATGGYFASSGTDAAPLHALQNGVDGPNGLYLYGAGGVFPTDSFNATNYWVDVVLVDSEPAPDTTPPTLATFAPGAGAADVALGSAVSARFSEPMDGATLDASTFALRDASNGLVQSSVSYTAGTQTTTLVPSAPLAPATLYTVTLRGGASAPHVTDLAGNALAADFSWSFTTQAAPPSDDGPGGPILIVAHAADPFGRYYAEILRAEGLNAFRVSELSLLTPALLATYDVAILAPGPLGASDVTLFTDWVSDGGNLIAMRPDPALAALLGIGSPAGVLGDAYLRVDPTHTAGQGIVTDTLQFHGVADRWSLAGADAIAMLYSDAVNATTHPAVTLRSIGANGGQAASFAYDLARSVVYTRQGNPAWAGQERDGVAPIRSDDLFYGGAASDPQPDWVDLDKVGIPQADEQMRLLANLILRLSVDRQPLPRFWYLPRDLKAAVVMTGDDHGSAGMQPRFDTYIAQSPSDCVVEDWECVRASGYLYVNPPFSAAQAQSYAALGFETALHVSTNCSNWTPTSLAAAFDAQLGAFASAFPGVTAPRTSRTHCIAWSDWASAARIEAQHGIRLDTNYYYWPQEWVQNRPGYFTGSAMPMRFADVDGSTIDCYQVVTQLTDESGQDIPAHVTALLDRAVGSEGYYGVICANMHFDHAQHAGSDAIVAAALARGVAVVSARQMLDWLDGRNGSSFADLSWDGSTLSFATSVASGARNLRSMLPLTTPAGELSSLTHGVTPITWTTTVVKGIEYACFPAESGSYSAHYAPDLTPPSITDVSATPASDGTSAAITWTTDELASSHVAFGTSPASLDSSENATALVTSHALSIAGLAPGTTYYYRVSSANAAARSTTFPPPPSAPSSFATPTPACASETSFAEFASGSTGSSTYVAHDADGELTLAPLQGAEFETPGTPAGWSSTAWQVGGNASINGGAVLVDGTAFGPTTTFAPGTTLEFTATFGASGFQHVGLSDDFNSAWLIFSTSNTTGTLFARTNPGVDTPIPGSWIGSAHRYRIEWNASQIVYSIDGNVVATHDFSIGTSLRALASDFNFGGPVVRVESLRILPYAPSGSFDSRVLDAGSPVEWGAATWNAAVPPGTSLALFARAGPTAIPDGSWSAFTPLATSGTPLQQSGRYLQYRAELATTNPELTPALHDIQLVCSADACPNDPNKTAPGACGCDVADTDSDGDGTPDCTDGCPNDPSKVAEGVCGCGVADLDSDGDNVLDCRDGCPLDPSSVVAATWYADADGDGHGSASSSVRACTQPPGYVANGTDCDDANAAVHPGAQEVCGNALDDDCDGNVDIGGVDSNPPVITSCAEPQTAAANATCSAALPNFAGASTATDDCSTPRLTQSPGAGSALGLGVHIVTITATDAALNTATCTTTFTVRDTTPPTIQTCASALDLGADASCQAVLPELTGAVTARDNCSGVTITQAPSAGSSLGLGTHSIVLTVTDAANNASTCTALVSVSSPDSDGDGTVDCQDGCAADPQKTAPGACGCGVVETDTDADGIADCIDNCDTTVNAVQADADGDGVGDACDNCASLPNASQADCDADSIGDACELAAGAPDCNFNGVPDACDLVALTSLDSNQNSVPDECETSGGNPYCFGDGSGSACPCGNVGQPGNGCPHSFNTAGARLGGSGTSSLSADTFVLLGSGMPSVAPALYFQGTARVNAGAGSVFGDGLRCAGGHIIRLKPIVSSGGASHYPEVGDAPVSVRGLVTVPGPRVYQIWFRNGGVFCTSALFNLTNGLDVIWVP